jgi:ATP-dependent phosphofructokinase / diphosphate-dependent phosphofructokinase
MPKNAFYAQSGGVTAVINASACGVIETARKHPDKIGKVYAGRNGIIGALTEDLIDTTQESDADIAALRYTPAGAFGSCRFKLKGLDQSKAEYEHLKRTTSATFSTMAGATRKIPRIKSRKLGKNWVIP